MKFIKYLSINFLFCLLLTAQVKAGPSTPIRLQLKWHHQFQFAGYYAAQIKGFYKKEGLNIKIIPGGPNILPVQNIINGTAEIGVFDSNVLLRTTAKKPLVVLANIMQSSPYAIISLKKKNILKPSDLAGKSILVQEDQGWNIFKAILLKEGINSDQIKIIPRSKDSEELIENKADALVTYLTTQPQRLKALGYDVNVIRPVEYGIDFYGDVLFTTKDYAYKNTEVTDAFIRASLKGWEYALTHEDEIINYILKLPGVKEYGTNKALLKTEAVEVKKLIMPDLIKIGNINIGRWQYMLTIYQQLGITNKNITLKDFIYHPKENTLKTWLFPILYGLIVILLIFLLVGIINWQLRTQVKVRTSELQKEIINRKDAEQQAYNSKEQIELILKGAKIGLWDWDLITNKKTISKQWCELLGIESKNAAINFDPFSVIHPEDLEKSKQVFNKSIEGLRSKEHFHFRILKANGEYMHLLSNSKVLIKNGVAVKISGVLVDIDHIKKKEHELIVISEELMQSNNELKKFAYITSHNLRGPLVNITSLFELLNKDEVSDQNKIIYDKIEISVLKLENTLNDLIDIVSHQKPENKTLSLLNFNNELKETIASIEYQFNKSEAKVTANFEVENIIFSKKYFESILINLLSNAIKYKSAERTLEIKIRTYENEEYVILEIKDNGIGIDLIKNGSKLFGLYQRFRPEIEGKGIGLFIVKSHIESMNGKILVESKVNEGTAFTIYFSKKQLTILEGSNNFVI